MNRTRELLALVPATRSRDLNPWPPVPLSLPVPGIHPATSCPLPLTRSRELIRRPPALPLLRSTQSRKKTPRNPAPLSHLVPGIDPATSPFSLPLSPANWFCNLLLLPLSLLPDNWGRNLVLLPSDVSRKMDPAISHSSLLLGPGNDPATSAFPSHRIPKTQPVTSCSADQRSTSHRKIGQ